MNKTINSARFLITKAMKDSALHARLVAGPKRTIEQELGVTLADGHAIHVHVMTAGVTHLVLPPSGKRSEEERQAAITGQTSLAFLKKTMHDPAPPLRPAAQRQLAAPVSAMSAAELAGAGRESIRRGLGFLESAVDANGAWHCIRFNIADPDIPRHYEKSAFVSAFCALALESCEEVSAKSIYARTLNHIVETMEYPGLWRYYRHLPQDLDSTTLCSLLIGSHPWIVLGRNVPQILANRDGNGRFMTWLLTENEPDVVARFRIEADPVVNAAVIAWLGDCPETRPAQRWLEAQVREDKLRGASKWYPDTVTIYYLIARAMVRAAPAFAQLREELAKRILELWDRKEGFGNVLLTAQAISALSDIDGLDHIDTKVQFEKLLSWQNENGSWPELLASGDQSQLYGVLGKFGFASESTTTAFCIEALERLLKAAAV